MIRAISRRLRNELPGLRGFGETNLKNMRTFYEAWNSIEDNSSVETDELKQIPPADTATSNQTTKNEKYAFRQLELTKLENQPMGVATYKTAEEMDAELMKMLPPKEQLEKLLED